MNANQACCACGGGLDVRNATSPSSSPTTSPTGSVYEGEKDGLVKMYEILNGIGWRFAKA